MIKFYDCCGDPVYINAKHVVALWSNEKTIFVELSDGKIVELPKTDTQTEEVLLEIIEAFGD